MQMFQDKPRGLRPVEGQDGNWKCSTCAEINFASRVECHRCRNPFLGGGLGGGGGGLADQFGQLFPGAGMPFGGAAKVGGSSVPVEGVGGNWRCTNCANVNFAKREHCNRCQAMRPPFDHILAREQELEQERAVAAASGATVAAAAGQGRAKFAPPVAGIDGNWECFSCMSVNFASREHCHRCTAGRPPQEAIKRRAEQIKAERAVQLATNVQNPNQAQQQLGQNGLGGMPNQNGFGGTGGLPVSAGLGGAGGMPGGGGLGGGGLPGQNMPGAMPGALGLGGLPTGPFGTLQNTGAPETAGLGVERFGQAALAQAAGLRNPQQMAGYPQQMAQAPGAQNQQMGMPQSVPQQQVVGGQPGSLYGGAPGALGAGGGLGSLPSAAADVPASQGFGAADWGNRTIGGGDADWGLSAAPGTVMDRGMGAFGNAPVSALEADGRASAEPMNGHRSARQTPSPPPSTRIIRGRPLHNGDRAAWVVAGGVVYLSQFSAAPMEGLVEGCDLASSHAQRQALVALTTLEALLNAAGTTRDRLLDVTLHVTEAEDLEAVQAVWSSWVASLDGHLPCKSFTIGPSAMGQLGCRVAIKAVAKTGSSAQDQGPGVQ